MKRDKMIAAALTAIVVSATLTASAYLPPVETKLGVKVEIGSFPQSIDRTAKNPYSWPLGVTEVEAGKPREFPVTLENTTDKPIDGRLEVWMNDDWTVSGSQGPLTLAPKEKRNLSFIGTAKPSALHALYPVHARFTPKGADKVSSPHPIAVFMFKNHNAPRALHHAEPTVLKAGEFRLDRGFERKCAVEVGGKVHSLAESGDGEAWGGGFTKGRVYADGSSKSGFVTHPPYKKGAGFVWSEFSLAMPEVKPIALDCSLMIRSNRGDEKSAPSDGVEYKVLVVDEGGVHEVASQLVTEPFAWKPMTADLTKWAGKKIALRLWTGPGPKMVTCCDGGGWGDVRLLIGPQPKPSNANDWTARSASALAAARLARAEGTDEAANRWQLKADDGAVYGAAAVFGERGLIDGALAFTDGEKDVVYRGFEAEVDTGDGNTPPEAKAVLHAEKDTLRISWSIPGHRRDPYGFPRISRLAVGPSSERPFRVFAGFGNVIENPKSFTLSAGGFALSTRHVGADYANGFSVVQAVDLPPDALLCNGDANRFSLQAHHNATFTFVPSSKGAFEAARRFRAVAGYRKSPGHDRLGSRMCLDQWGGDYAKAAANLRLAGKYGMNDCVFVKHDWQCWGYDYRLPEIYPPRGNANAFGDMRNACRETGILFVPHDNYTDIYPDADNYSYDLVVFNLDGTPQRAWFNPGRHALSYRWAPHAFHPWCLRNAKLLKGGFDPDGIFIDVFTAHAPFDYLDRNAHFHDRAETAASWAKGFELYRQGYGKPNAVCLSEAGQDHLVGCADGGQSDHFSAAKLVGDCFGDAERTPWHDIVSHGYYVLFAGGLGGRYQEERWHSGGDSALHGYASDDYLSNCIIGGRNPMCEGPFSRKAVQTYWQQHDACAELGKKQFLDLRYEGNIHRQHAFFSDGGEVWVNRQTNAVWKLANGIVLPPYGYYAKTHNTESGIVEKDGVRCGFSFVRPSTSNLQPILFCDARKPSKGAAFAAETRVLSAERLAANRWRLKVEWKTVRPVRNHRAFMHICDPEGRYEGIEAQANLPITDEMFATPGTVVLTCDVTLPNKRNVKEWTIRYGAYNPSTGTRMALGGAPSDANNRICGGRVTKDGWQAEREIGSRAARDRQLGINREGKMVDFGGIRTDGSFVIRQSNNQTIKQSDNLIIPLPDSQGFTVEIDTERLKEEGWRLNDGVLTSVSEIKQSNNLKSEDTSFAPQWKQEGTKLTIKVDGRAFAYRLEWGK